MEALFQGTVPGEVVEGGLTSRVVVRFPERLRLHRDDLDALPVTTPAGHVLRLGEVARVRFDLGPGLVRRENVQRLAMITANIAGSDLTGVVEKAREALRAGLSLPEGYRVVFGGQFEEAERSLRNLGNHVVPGGNYGWPTASSLKPDPTHRGPLIESAGATWKPSGIAVRGETLYVAALLGRQLVRIRLRPEPVAPLPSLLEGTWGRLRDVVVGPDGALYVATSNRDLRGAPGADDDRILRVLP